MMFTRILIGAVLATLAMSGAAGAQQLPAATQQSATIKRTPLQKFERARHQIRNSVCPDQPDRQIFSGRRRDEFELTKTR